MPEPAKVSLLDCIKRTPVLMDEILKNREQAFQPLFQALSGWKPQAVVLIGSGTSNTASVTARFFIEKVTHLPTTAVYPNDFLNSTGAYNPQALHIFVSQTGTSGLVRQAQKALRDKGFKTAAMTEHPGTPLAQETPIHIPMGCGNEEYPMRTIGYSTSVYTLMLLGLELARSQGIIDEVEHEKHLKNAKAASAGQLPAVAAAMAWMDSVKRTMLRSQCIVFAGAGALQGVALEAAVKVWEIPQIPSIGYELEESLHGPNYGYNHNHCVVALHQGGKDAPEALALARWMQGVYRSGFAIGPATGSTIGSESAGLHDLNLVLDAFDFNCLIVAPALQVLAYRLAHDQGRDLYAPHDNSVMNSYFNTHQLDAGSEA
ncbi:MAG: SIS domain-containing protein [Clostridiales bacterium]|jgi:glucosamine 6-phosphate synthetase-like amidotransferase/phosphosugar isomerase protein|nr:SIS domain-containing protein [Clostridiales bacterium]